MILCLKLSVSLLLLLMLVINFYIWTVFAIWFFDVIKIGHSCTHCQCCFDAIFARAAAPYNVQSWQQFKGECIVGVQLTNQFTLFRAVITHLLSFELVLIRVIMGEGVILTESVYLLLLYKQIWILDTADGSARVLRQRTGHSAPPIKIRCCSTCVLLPTSDIVIRPNTSACWEKGNLK